MTSITNDWTNVLSPERNEIVFENRNQSYGAYVIRRDYSRTLFIALLSTTTAILLLVLIPQWFGLFNTTDVYKRVKDEPQIFECNFTPDTPIEEPKTHREKTNTQPKLKQDIAAPPVVVDDKVAEKPIPSQELPTTTEGNSQTTLVGDNSSNNFASNTPGTIEPQEPPVEVPEINPSFPGGEKAMYAYLSYNLRFPEILRQKGIMGKVYITFVVDKNGKIISVKERMGIEGGKEFTVESIRVISGMPQWIPGRQGGRSVPVIMTLPVSFTLH